MIPQWQHNAAWQNPAALRDAWAAATPFAHIVIDDVLAEADLAALLEILDEEPVEFGATDIYAFDATAPTPVTPAMAALRDSFAAALAPLLTQISGRAVSQVDMRAYAYRPGHFLLPHTDHQDELRRVVAYAFYLPTPAPPVGGELELFAAHLHDGQFGAATSAQLYSPTPNRLVVFEVSALSLHQVREVLQGLRLSLAGWFYP